MRVLITNSLVLAAISLAPSVSAAPYTTTSSVDSYDSDPNLTMLVQDSGPSSVPSTLYPYGRMIPSHTQSHPQVSEGTKSSTFNPSTAALLSKTSLGLSRNPSALSE